MWCAISSRKYSDAYATNSLQNHLSLWCSCLRKKIPHNPHTSNLAPSFDFAFSSLPGRQRRSVTEYRDSNWDSGVSWTPTGPLASRTWSPCIIPTCDHCDLVRHLTSRDIQCDERPKMTIMIILLCCNLSASARVFLVFAFHLCAWSDR